MTIFPNVESLLATMGGIVGVALIAANSYHNWMVRRYLKRQTAALEKIAREK